MISYKRPDAISGECIWVLYRPSKKKKNLFRLNRRSNMHVKQIGKMVAVVKCRFLVTLMEKLHQFIVVNPIKIHMQIEELVKL